MKCGCDLVEVSAHAGARPEHQIWQGKVYSRSGESKKYPSLKEATGYGTGAGLGGWNCRHSFYPFYKDVSVRAYTDKELEELKKENKDDIITPSKNNEGKEVQTICNIDRNKLGEYKNRIVTEEVVLTNERLNHILEAHKTEYEQLEQYIKDIIINPDFIIKDNKHNDTVILLKNISEINKNGRVVIKLALEDIAKNKKNSIITLMKLNERTWKQTIKNRGNIIYKNRDLT